MHVQNHYLRFYSCIFYFEGFSFFLIQYLTFTFESQGYFSDFGHFYFLIVSYPDFGQFYFWPFRNPPLKYLVHSPDESDYKKQGKVLCPPIWNTGTNVYPSNMTSYVRMHSDEYDSIGFHIANEYISLSLRQTFLIFCIRQVWTISTIQDII